MDSDTSQSGSALEQKVRALEMALEEQRAQAAAAAEILQAISNVRDNAQPVFDLLLRKAAALCSADAAALALGKKGDTHQTMPAAYEITPRTQEMYDTGQVPMDPDISFGAKAILSGKPVHIRDMSDTDNYRSGVSFFTSVVEDTGVRTTLLVPMMTPAGGIGVLILLRKEVNPYSDAEIALVQSFAAQAVIAIENARQFREVQTRLEREAATSDILSVISQSHEDETEAFESILQNAATLCQADQAALILANEERTSFRLTANWGHNQTEFDIGKTWPFDSNLTAGVVIRSAVRGGSSQTKDPIRVRCLAASELLLIEPRQLVLGRSHHIAAALFFGE